MILYKIILIGGTLLMEVCLAELIEQATLCLHSTGLSPETVDDYRWCAFNPIVERFGRECLVNSSLLLAQKDYFFQQWQTGTISRHVYNWRYRGIQVLAEVCDTGTYVWEKRSQEHTPLPPLFESVLSDFLQTLSCSEKKKNDYGSICRRLLQTLADSHITTFEGIGAAQVRDFVELISQTRPKSLDEVMCSLRHFFSYLCSKDLYRDNFWMLLASPKSRNHHVRNPLTSEEVLRLLSSIDRSTPEGKRNFAVLSLAAVTGIRQGDLATLKLSDIYWKEHEIRLMQGKTGEPLIVPVSKDVLNAVADYILNGRPKTEDKCVFVRHCSPFAAYSSGVSIACIFRKYLKAAGIEHVKGDGKTLHGMRRGLGTNMVNKEVTVDVVAQVLGHRDTRATRQYIAADMKHLRLCTLDFRSLGGVK